MPLIAKTSFSPAFYTANSHFQTIFPSLFRTISGVIYERERLELPDGDFVDLDFSRQGSDRCVIVLHGLEGNSERPYIKGVVKRFNQAGWDGVALNFRGCSGTPNRLARSYHSGETEDLDAVIQYLTADKGYRSISIVGFSLGGNVTLKYVGERGASLNKAIQSVVAFSAPVHLESASYELAKWYNKLYMSRFMRSLKDKIRSREAVVGDQVDLSKVYASKSFLDFDNFYTAPVHGFQDCVDYWTKSSSLQFLPNIRVPALLVNAQDDSFLSAQCYPRDVASAHKHFHLQVPKNGGHVGFMRSDANGFYWSENRALEFCEESLSK